MVADPQFVIRVLENHGCWLRLVSDRITDRMMSGWPNSDDLAMVIRHYRRILAELLREGDMSQKKE